jgi:hypothetical protein
MLPYKNMVKNMGIVIFQLEPPLNVIYQILMVVYIIIMGNLESGCMINDKLRKGIRVKN